MLPSRGLTADLYRRRTVPIARRRSAVPVITVSIALVLFSAFAAGMILMHAQGTSPVLAHQTVASNWDVETHQLIASEDPAKVLVSLCEDEFAQCCLISFDGFDVPFNFSGAVFTIPVVWFSAFDTLEIEPSDEGIFISVYEVRGSWSQWTSSEQTDGVTWDGIAHANPVVDREPLDTVFVDRTTFGYGTSTEGTLSLNVSRAVEDWFAGIWNPSFGLLIATVAPWQSYSTSLPDGFLATMHMLADDARIVVYDAGGEPIPIPEFSSVAVPVIAVMMIAVLALVRRRRTVSNNIVAKDDGPRTALSPSNALPENSTD